MFSADKDTIIFENKKIFIKDYKNTIGMRNRFMPIILAIFLSIKKLFCPLDIIYYKLFTPLSRFDSKGVATTFVESL